MATRKEFCDDALIVQQGRNNTLNLYTSEQVEFTLVYYYVGIAINIVCLAIWLMEKHKYERTQVRPTFYLVLAVISSIAEQSCGPLQTFVGEAYPCWLGVVLLLLVLPCAATSIFGRYMLFSFLSRFAQGAAQIQTQAEFETTQSVRSGTTNRVRTFMVRAKAVAIMLVSPNRLATSEDELYDLKFLSSASGITLTTSVLTLPVFLFAMIILATDPVVVYCSNCAYSQVSRNMIIGVSVALFMIGILFWSVARTNPAEDRWGIKMECFLSLVSVFIAIIGFFVSLYDQNQKAISPYTHNFMMTLGFWLLVIEQSVVQIVLARLGERKLEDLTVGPKKVTSVSQAENAVDELDEILSDKVLADHFEKHLMGEFGTESLFFLRQAEEWRRTYFDVASTARLARARKIYKSYINSNGLYSINVPSDTSDAIKRKLFASTADDVPREIFDDAIHDVHKLLLNGAVLRFKVSSRYQEATKMDNIREKSTVAVSSGGNLT